jgi:plasmid rolling circle replication initiator protein Rep
MQFANAGTIHVTVNIYNGNGEKNQAEDKPLDDVINGKPQPWRGKKAKTMRLSKAFNTLGENKKAARVWFCGSELGFLPRVEGGMSLKEANFCRERLCTMCNWRRSIKTFYQLSQIMDVAQEENPNAEAIFLTLTRKNCSGAELPAALDGLFAAWQRLSNFRRFRENVLGYFRALEVTYNQSENTYHPHFHVILLVDKSYFFTPKKYLHTADWVHIWRTALKADYDPICDIRAVKTHKEKKYKAVAEVAKYAVKDADYLFRDEELTTRVVGELGAALKGRRLFAFGGIIKQIAKRLKMDKLDEGDLIHITENAEMREDIADAIILYSWDFGLKDYFRRV